MTCPVDRHNVSLTNWPYLLLCVSGRWVKQVLNLWAFWAYFGNFHNNNRLLFLGCINTLEYDLIPNSASHNISCVFFEIMNVIALNFLFQIWSVLFTTTMPPSPFYPIFSYVLVPFVLSWTWVMAQPPSLGFFSFFSFFSFFGLDIFW